MKTCAMPTPSSLELGHPPLDLGGDQVKSARPRTQRDLGLDPHPLHSGGKVEAAIWWREAWKDSQ